MSKLRRAGLAAVIIVLCAGFSRGDDGDISVTPDFKREVFAMDEKSAALSWKIANRGKTPWSGALSFGIDGFVFKELNLSLARDETKTAETEFCPGMLRTGTYPVSAALNGGAPRRLAQITAGPWRNPERYLMMAWPRLRETGWIKEMVDMGLNVVSFGSVKDLDLITSLGAYGGVRIDTVPPDTSQSKSDMRDTAYPCLSGKEYLQKCESDALALLAKYGSHPSIKMVNINTEMWGRICFCDNCRRLMRERFGLDPDGFQAAVEKDGAARHKRTLLMPAAAPEDMIVSPENSPLLRFADWWWREGGMSAGNQLVGDTLSKAHPGIIPLAEPVMRFAPVQRYRPPMVIDDWSWPADPRDYIFVSAYVRDLAESWGCKYFLLVTTLKLPGTFAPYMTGAPPDHFRMSNWICLSAFPAGLLFTRIDTMMPPEKQDKKSSEFYSVEECEKIAADPGRSGDLKKILGKGSFLAWQPGLPEILKDFSSRVTGPLGPLLGKTSPRKAKIGVFHSFTTRLLSGKAWWDQFQWRPLAEKILKDDYDTGIIFEDQLKSANLNDYKIIVMPAVYHLTGGTVEIFQNYIRGGGILLCDRNWAERLPGAVAVDGLRPAEKNGPARDLDAQLMMDGAKTGGAGNDIAGLRKIISEKLKPDYHSGSPDILIREGGLRDTRIIILANIRLVKGPVFGKYPGAFEKSEAVQSKISVANEGKHLYAYDLLTGAELELKSENGRSCFDVSLPPAEGKIIAFYKQRPGKMTISSADSARPAERVKITAGLCDSDGNLFSGAAPLRFHLSRPDGAESEFSHYSCVENGVWEFEWQVPAETQSGKDSLYGDWRVTVKELASGKSGSKTIRITRCASF
jgi:hypothetical protein